MAISIQALKDRERVAPDWVLPGLLKRQNTAIMLGPPKKAAKSWLVLALCWDLSEGKAVWDIKDVRTQVPLLVPPRPMRCVYFTQEDTVDDAQDRVLSHFSNHREANNNLWIVPKNLNIKLDTREGRQLVQEELDAVKEQAGDIDLVCFDPLRRMISEDESSSTVIAKMWEVLDRVHRRYNCASLITHHVVKPPQDKSKGYDPTDPFTGRGSGDIYGGGDAFMVVVPGTGNEEHRKVGMFFESKRGAQLPPAILKVMFKTGEVRYLGQGFEPTRQESEVTI